jgi:hypothetical protein
MSKQFFQKKVDRRSRSAMVDFLKAHYRYNTMSSWNRATSYAHCIKIHRLGLTSEQSDKAYEMLDTDFWDEIRWSIDDFTTSQGSCYTIGTNGRSGGYLVLYQSRRELTGHLSYCPSCGQRNFKKVPPTFDDASENVIAQEILRSQSSWHPGVYLTQSAIEALPLSNDEKLSLIVRIKTQLVNCSATDACGVCSKPRRNFDVPPSQLSIYPGKSIDQDEDFYAEDWSMEALRDRVDLVCAFDAACGDIRSNFIALLDDFDVVEETIRRPVKVKKLVARAA